MARSCFRPRGHWLQSVYPVWGQRARVSGSQPMGTGVSRAGTKPGDLQGRQDLRPEGRLVSPEGPGGGMVHLEEAAEHRAGKERRVTSGHAWLEVPGAEIEEKNGEWRPC